MSQGGTTLRSFAYEANSALRDDVRVVDATSSPAKLYYVHVDHLDRPALMTKAAKAAVWKASYEPFGAVRSITGSAALDLAFPGQWFQLESGLAYNWHRHYDPTTGRHTQPDPLGFVDGPSVYGYARQSPEMGVDPTGRQSSGGMLCFFGIGCAPPETVCRAKPDDDKCSRIYEEDTEECNALKRYMDNRDPKM